MAIDPLLRDSFAHEVWANRALLSFCGQLTPEQLRATTPGAYDSIAQTIRHVLDAAAWYQHRLGLERLGWEERDEHTVDVAELGRRADEVAARWERVFERPFDPERIIDTPPGDDPVEHIRAGVYVAQVFNHGSEHRDQVCTILTTLGIQPPELDVWAYAWATGRLQTDPDPTV
ncbi:MAG: DinB family protein [Actinomycetota bacterium]